MFRDFVTTIVIDLAKSKTLVYNGD